jgi:hypothetical protein
MQEGAKGPARPPIGIAFEGDLAQRIDAVLAIALLNGFAGKTEARSIAVAISRPSLKAAQFAEVLARFYSPRPALIGVPEGAAPDDDSPVLAKTLSEKNAEGAPRYTSTIKRLLDTPDNAVLIRNNLLAQHDGNARIVTAGPATGAARLLGLFGARPQIQAKVERLIITAGSLPAGPPDPAIAADVASARRIFAEWPTPIVVVGAEVGEALPYPGASIEKDFTWAPAHPVADAYRVAKPMPYDAPAPALAAMLYAIKPNEPFFKVSDAGTITVSDDGRLRFAPAADGRHRYLIVDAAQKDKVLETYTALVPAKPAPGPGRGRGGAELESAT